MIRQLPFVAALAVIAAAGLGNGLWNDRWRVSSELAELAARIPKIPEKIGPWSVVAKDPELQKQEDEFNARLKRNGTLHEVISRTYRRETGEVVAMLVATGRPGPISTHNPQTCIGASDKVKTLSAVIAVPIKIGDSDAIFSYCDFLKTGIIPGGEGLRIYWSWHDDKKGWVASDDPRTTFAAQRALTKIYVTRLLAPTEMKDGGEKPDTRKPGPAVQFIQECLPTIDKVLFK